MLVLVHVKCESTVIALIGVQLSQRPPAIFQHFISSSDIPKIHIVVIEMVFPAELFAAREETVLNRTNFPTELQGRPFFVTLLMPPPPSAFFVVMHFRLFNEQFC